MIDPSDYGASNEDLSHGLLVALLAALGGSYDLEAHQLQPDAMGNARGEFYGVAMSALDDGNVRLQLVPQSERTE